MFDPGRSSGLPVSGGLPIPRDSDMRISVEHSACAEPAYSYGNSPRSSRDSLLTPLLAGTKTAAKIEGISDMEREGLECQDHLPDDGDTLP